MFMSWRGSMVVDLVSAGDRAGLSGAGLSEQADCSAFQLHAERVQAARAAALDIETLAGLGELFKVFSDPTRLRILGALVQGELCVCDLGAVLGASQSAVSHQLAVLRAARMVAWRREGKTVYYRLADDHVGQLLRLGFDHATERSLRAGAERA
jgi:ArsR family transcriptional regulator, lead/cadmium/zinc/bismuth-responsive transcriptional repressor